MGRVLILLPFITLATSQLFISCEEGQEHIAPAIHDRDSVSTMISYGVNTLISDSGVIKYKIVTERWDVNTIKNPTRWTFICGIFMEQFDEKFHTQAYILADTAWYYDQKKLWELRGRVRIRNVNGLIFNSEELFWDGLTHEFYSNKFSKVITPERTMQGTYFRSDEKMAHYTVSNSKGSFVRSEGDDKPAAQQQPATQPNANANANTKAAGGTAAKDSIKDTIATPPMRPHATKRAATNNNRK